jgi:hypothetical protein
MIPLCMNILSRISESERDLIRVIVDVVTEIRLGEEDGRERGMSMVSVHPERDDGSGADRPHRCLMMIRCL